MPSFPDNVTSTNKNSYEKWYAELKTAVQKDSVNCYKYLNTYVNFFKDNHTDLSENKIYKPLDLQNDSIVNSFLQSEFYAQQERVIVTSNYFKDRSKDSIEGIYELKDAYTIAIIKSPKMYRDYIGVIVKSNNPVWKPGDIKIELKREDSGLFSGYVYASNYTKITFRNHDMQFPLMGFKKKNTKPVLATTLSTTASFTVLNKNTTYLRIPDFSGNLYTELQALYKEATPQITAHDNLIIDVRGNGGGSDYNTTFLISLLYTNPIKTGKVETFVTTDNIKHYENWLKVMEADSANYSAASIANQKEVIQQMKAIPLQTFYGFKEEGELTQPTSYKQPKNIVILYDRGCASSCETLIYYAKQSSKTTLMGQNSYGALGYGNNLGEMYTPNYNFLLTHSTTRHFHKRKYEIIGISPDIRLNYQQNWIDEALLVLENKK
ncbi:MAG: S41 family peptidase [Kordia sp.]|uniref:S41 family peptidase n=1 Tax=Kordia sp. TaxID=1965332 RepID=UPI00385D5B11